MSEAHASDRRIAYQPALDGLRALAVLGVLAYHHRGIAGSGSLGRGGFIGVDLFFVLSGFLITSLLLTEYRGNNAIALGSFWVRRLRRLTPALLLTVAFTVLLARTVYPERIASLVKEDLPWVLTYLRNWPNAFGRGSIDSPLSHTWSLAVEEQWYLVWPIVLLAILRVAKGRRNWTLAAVGGLALASTLWGAYLIERSGLVRAFFGTDVRAQQLLVGAALAVLGTGGAIVIRRAGWVQAFGLTALIGVVGIMAFGRDGPDWYPFGRVGLAFLVAIVILAAVQPRGAVRSILAVVPLVWLGRISYGVYLFHFPIFRWLGPSTTGLDGAGLFAVRFAVTIAVALLSFTLVEQPIRRGHVPTRVLVPIGAVTAVALLVVGTVGVADALPQPRSPLLAKYLPEFAAKGPPGARHVLLVGGERADDLSATTLHQPVLEAGDWVLAIGDPRCGLTTEGGTCRAFSDDLPAIAGAFRATRILLTVEERDLATLGDGGREDLSGLVQRFDDLASGLGADRVTVVTLPCNTRREQLVRRVNAAISAWATQRSIAVRSLDGEPCSDDLRSVAPTRALWRKILETDADRSP